MADGSPAKRKYADIATVTLLVGEAKTAFHVHEASLFEASPVFKAAFTSDFQESSERRMTLPEDDEVTFEIFVDWLYKQRYELPSSSQEKGRDRYMQPFKLFIFADKYGVHSLKNHIVSQIFSHLSSGGSGPSCDAMTYVYEHTSEGSTIRNLIADRLACVNDQKWFQEESSQTFLRSHADICLNLVLSFAKHTQRRNNPFRGKIPEEYQEKEPGSEK